VTPFRIRKLFVCLLIRTFAHHGGTETTAINYAINSFTTNT